MPSTARNADTESGGPRDETNMRNHTEQIFLDGGSRRKDEESSICWRSSCTYHHNAWMLVRQSIDGNDNQHVRVVSKRGEIKSENARVHDEVSDKPKLQMYYIHPYADVAFI